REERMATSIWFWVAFNAFVIVLLAIDLGIFHRKAHEVSLREATAWSIVWVALSLLFAGGIYLYAGARPATEFLTGYLIEKSLSVDNIFVMVMIFTYLEVPSRYQHRVLFWGILGALVMRGAFIAIGALLLSTFHWVIYIFGALLIVTGARMAIREEKPPEIEGNPLVRLAARFIPITTRYHGQSFFAIENAKRVATPLFLAVLLVEFTDLIFALDSIPAIFGITRDPFLVYTSNVFAILGLRALYFVLAGVVTRFHLLRFGLAAILVFVGIKMLIDGFFEIPVLVALAVIAVILILTVVASLLIPEGGKGEGREQKAESSKG
ncbi:MAG TPA: TerC family protein, partial [Gemmatimonadaceae bacterium]|nr:TerC family protein [Gemmatimonadaceae bacterium]